MIELTESVDKIWRPNPGPQEEFLSLPDSIFEGFYGGAAGGGKTDALLMYPIVRGWYKISSFRGIYFRRTYPMLEEYAIPQTKAGIGFRDGSPGPSFYDFGGSYNGTEHTWTFRSGATIKLGYLKDEDNVYDHKSSQFHYMAFDELTTFTKFMYMYMQSRVRTVDPRLPAIMRSASNPGDIGNEWVRTRFVEPERKGRKILLLRNSQGTTTKAIFIPAKLKDNPCLTKVNPDYETRLDNLPEAERRALKDGDFWIFAGQFFTEFRERHIEGEPENAVHVVTPFEIPKFWPKVLSVDWGFDHKNAVHCTAISPAGRIVVFYEDVRRKELISQWAPDIALDLASLKENIKAKVIDPSSNRHDGHEETIKEQIQRYSGFAFEDAENSRVSGWALMRDFLRWRQKSPRRIPNEGYSPEYALRILRLQGEKAHSEYLRTFEPEAPELNIPRLVIFNTCTDLIKTIPLAIHDEKHPEDIEKFDGDDSLDDIRYNLKRVNQYVEQCANEWRIIQAKDEILTQLATTGDMTSFYQRMRKHEADNKVVPFRLRRSYHGNRGGRYAVR